MTARKNKRGKKKVIRMEMVELLRIYYEDGTFKYYDGGSTIFSIPHIPTHPKKK